MDVVQVTLHAPRCAMIVRTTLSALTECCFYRRVNVTLTRSLSTPVCQSLCMPTSMCVCVCDAVSAAVLLAAMADYSTASVSK